MSPPALAILLFAGGVILLLAEVFLPTHGLLGIMGALGLLGGVGVCFSINQFLGLGAAVTLVVLMPFAMALWVKVWPHTPVGKLLILGPVKRADDPAPAGPPVHVGQVGVAISELRPGGMAEFGPAGERVEVRCEHGMIPAGQRVEVVAVVDHRPLVRAAV